MDGQIVQNKIKIQNSQGKEINVTQNVKLDRDYYGEDEKLISVKHQTYEQACITKNKAGEYYLKLTSNFKNALGQELSLYDSYKIVSDKNNPPIHLGSGLQDELIVSISGFDGKIVNVKITPTAISIIHNDGTTYYSQFEDERGLDMDISPTVVEEMYDQTNEYFDTPVVLGKGYKAPSYLLGMYAEQQVEMNSKIQLGNIGIIKIERNGSPIVFFSQKTNSGESLYIYNNGVPKKIDSYFYSKNSANETFLTLQTSTGMLNYNIPLSENSQDILKLFEGLSIREINSTSKKNLFSALVPTEINQISPTENPYNLFLKPISGKENGLQEIPFVASKFKNDEHTYFVNVVSKSIFVMEDDNRISWLKYSDYVHQINDPATTGGTIWIQRAKDGSLFFNGNDENGGILVSKIENIDGKQVLTAIDSEQYNSAVVTPAEKANSQDSNKPIEQPMDNEISTSSSTEEEQVEIAKEYVEPEEPKSSAKEEEEEPIRIVVEPEEPKTHTGDETSAEEELETPAETPAEEQIPSEDTPHAKKPNASNKGEQKKSSKSKGKTDSSASGEPKQKKVDFKKQAETISTSAMGIGLFMMLAGAIFLPWLIVAGIALTTVAGLTNSFSDMFKFNAYSTVKSKIKQAEREEKGRSREREKELESFNEKEKNLEKLSQDAEKISGRLLDQSTNESSAMHLFANLCNDYGMNYPTLDNPDAILNFNNLVSPTNLDALSYRQAMVAQFDEIAHSRSPRTEELANDFFSEYFKNVPIEERNKFLPILTDRSTLGGLRRDLTSLNECQQKIYDIEFEQRQFFTDERLGMDRIQTILSSLPEEDKSEFLAKHSKEIVQLISQNTTNMTSRTDKLLSCFDEKNQIEVLEILTQAQNELSFTLNDGITAVAKEHVYNNEQLKNAEEYVKLIPLADVASKDATSSAEKLKKYTDAQIHAIQLNSNIPDFGAEIDGDALNDQDKHILNVYQTLDTDFRLVDAIKELEKACKDYNIDEKINQLAEYHSVDSLLPKYSDTSFDPAKSYYSLASSIAQTNIDIANASAWDDSSDEISDSVLDNTIQEQLTASATAVVSAKTLVDNLIKDESEQSKEFALKIVDTLIDTGEYISSEDITQLKLTLKESEFGKSLLDEDLERLAKARLIARKREETRTATTPEQEMTESHRQSLYHDIGTTLDLAINGKLSALRISNAFAQGTARDTSVIAKTPAEVYSENERIFNCQFNKFIATLPAEQQAKIKSIIYPETGEEKVNPTPQDKINKLRQVLGNEMISICGETFDKFVEHYTHDGVINFNEAYGNALRETERKRVAVEMKTFEDRILGMGAIDRSMLSEFLTDKCNLLNGTNASYENIVDWIERTQHISKDVVAQAYMDIIKSRKEHDGSQIDQLFTSLGLDEKAKSLFDSEKKKITSLSLEESFSTFDLFEAEDKLFETNTKNENNFKNELDKIIQLAKDNADWNAKLSEFTSKSNYQALLNELSFPVELIKQAQRDASVQDELKTKLFEFQEGPIYSDFARKLAKNNNFVALMHHDPSATKPLLDTTVQSEEELQVLEDLCDNQPHLTYKMLKLKSEQVSYDEKSKEFVELYKNFINNPDATNSSVIIDFANSIDNEQFFATAGFSKETITRLAKTTGDLDAVKVVTKTFERENKIQDKIEKAKDKFNQRQTYLENVSLASSPEEIDRVKEESKLKLIEQAGQVFEGRVQEINNLPKDQQAHAMHALLTYYHNVGMLLEAKKQPENPIVSLQHNSISEEANIQENINNISNAIDDARESLEYYSISLSTLDLELDSIFITENSLSSEYLLSLTGENNITPIDYSLTGKDLEKALKKHNKQVRKAQRMLNNGKLKKNFARFTTLVQAKKEAKEVELDDRKQRLNNAKANNDTKTQTKQGLNVLGQLFTRTYQQKIKERELAQAKELTSERAPEHTPERAPELTPAPEHSPITESSPAPER